MNNLVKTDYNKNKFCLQTMTNLCSALNWKLPKINRNCLVIKVYPTPICITLRLVVTHSRTSFHRRPNKAPLGSLSIPALTGSSSQHFHRSKPLLIVPACRGKTTSRHTHSRTHSLLLRDRNSRVLSSSCPIEFPSLFLCFLWFEKFFSNSQFILV